MRKLFHTALLLGGAAGAAAATTWILLGTRVLLGEGGLCSISPGSSHPCPSNLATTLVIAAAAALLAIAAHMSGARRLNAPSLGGLLWAALMIGSAWNVYEVGTASGAEQAGFGVIFVAAALLMMGALPLLVLFTGALLGIFGPDDRDIFQRPEPPVARRSVAAETGPGHLWTSTGGGGAP